MTKRLAWLSDLHLEFVQRSQATKFAAGLAAQQPDAVVISGDIADAKTLLASLELLARAVPCDVYFVLGNHDYYRGSIGEVRTAVGRLRLPNLHYLATMGAVQLCAGVALLGHDGWADARNGDYKTTELELNDFYLIRDFRPFRTRWERYYLMAKLADKAARHFDDLLPRAAAESAHVIAVTHVPPFAEAAFWQGQPSEPDALAFFSNRCVGEVMLRVMANHRDCRLTVLCGHTHEEGVYAPAPNVVVRSARAEYEQPDIADILILSEPSPRQWEGSSAQN